ncbi:MAG: hypothetical protein WCI17_04510 [bacterium]
MNRMIRTAAVLAVAGVMAGGATAFAAECATQANPAKARGAGIVAKLKEITLTGSVARQDIKIAGKNRASYVLVTAAGDKLRLPAAKPGKKAASEPAIKLADYIGQNVKVVAMGSEQKKGDKTVVRMKLLKAIEKVPVA